MNFESIKKLQELITDFEMAAEFGDHEDINKRLAHAVGSLKAARTHVITAYKMAAKLQGPKVMPMPAQAEVQ